MATLLPSGNGVYQPPVGLYVRGNTVSCIQLCLELAVNLRGGSFSPPNARVLASRPAFGVPLAGATVR